MLLDNSFSLFILTKQSIDSDRTIQQRASELLSIKIVSILPTITILGENIQVLLTKVVNIIVLGKNKLL